ncbi:hypothetical protein BJY04DRAFT_28863 [Aspergillus karnatakaensis]|uniref:uncharacterized protein n=1 Tax=Aspergillus karnatakaensis TaxID=1810916 RepID=UPI003CCE4341
MTSSTRTNNISSLVESAWGIIIEFLVGFPPQKPDKDDIDCDWRPQNFSEHTPHLYDLIQLSGTCKRLRALLAPRIFETIYLNNTVESATSIHAIILGGHSNHVKKLRFIGICEQEQLSSPLEEVYPPEVHEILTHLSDFPNLRHLAVHFPFDYEALWSDGYFEGKLESSPEDALIQEQKNPWRGLMASSLNAVVTNNTLQGDANLPLSFELHHLGPVAVSTFKTPEFHGLLRRLTSFTLSLDPISNADYWQINTEPIFVEFVGCLGPWFIAHLHNIETLILEAPESSPLGNTGHIHGIDISLKQARMPRLRILTLRNIIVCTELSDFILRHLATLESITLQECYALNWDYTLSPSHIYWGELFSKLADACTSLSGMSSRSPTRLTHFHLCYDEPGIEKMVSVPGNFWQDLLVQAREKLANEPDTRPFFYANISEKWGGLVPDPKAVLEEFLDGQDYHCWKRLANVLKAN